MGLKKMIIVLTITIFTIFGLALGTSYSWYAYSNAESKVKGNTITEKPAIIFEQSEYVYAGTNMPILDEDRYNYAIKNSFNITMNENLKYYQTGIVITLDDIVISKELKIENYKYELLQDGIVINTGNFVNLTENYIELLPMTILTPSIYPHTYNYDFYLWLSEDGTNQNELMNKTFRAKININSAIKR